MWVSDKTILKLAHVLHVDAYALFRPITPQKTPAPEAENLNELLLDLEGKIIKIVQQQFMETIENSCLTSEEKPKP